MTQEIVTTGGENAQPVSLWDPNSGAPLPAYLTDFQSEIGSNIPDRQTVPSLSYEGKTWQVIVNGNRNKLQAKNSDGDMVPVPIMRVMILGINPDRGRAYYPGAYNPAASAAPTCWSADGKAPDPSVKEKQAALCNGCPMSVKGSKVDSGSGREMVACSSHRMLAVVPGFDIASEPLRLKIAVTSDYDKNVVEHGWFALRQYTDYLRAHGINHTALVITKIKFDNNESFPKLLFALDRPCTPDEVPLMKAAVDNPKVASLLSETWTAAGSAGTPIDDSDIKPWGLEGAYADGWQAHPDSPGWSWKGTEVVQNTELAGRYPEPVAPKLPDAAAPPIPVETPAPVAPVAAPPTAAPAGPTKPTDPSHIAHAGTEHEVWWIDNAWVKVTDIQATNTAAPVVEEPAPPPAPTPPPAPVEAAPPANPAPTDPAHIAHAGTEHEVWWDGAAWVKPWGNASAPSAAPAASNSQPSDPAASSPSAPAATSPTDAAAGAAAAGVLPAEVQGLLDKWTS